MTKILGKSVATAEQMAKYLLSVNKNPKFSVNITALEFAQKYLDICAKEGVRGDIAFAGACKETGHFAYGGDVEYTQNNFAGLGATGNGVKGCVFKDIDTGILAQAQHLKSYATKDNLNCPNVDPRRTAWFMSVKGGTSPDVETLGGTWAVPGYNTVKYKSLKEANEAKDSYGYNIVSILDKVIKTKIEEDKKMAIKVAIDAGHGSNTAGKRHPDGYREHYSNTKVAFYLDQILRANGFETYKSSWDDDNAKDDTDLTLASRQLLIKNAKCDICVSIHANAHGSGAVYTTAEGIETYYHSTSSKAGDSKALAHSIHNQLIKGTLQKNRGVKTAGFAMCNCTAMGVKAAVLVELAFMTNKKESDLLKSDAFLLESAKEIAQGIFNYYNFKGNVNILTTESKPLTSTPNPTISKNTPVGNQGDCPFIVKCLDNLNIRATAGGAIKVVEGCKKNVKYTITKVDGNWGYLKSGAGWISILSKYVTKC